MALRLSEKDVIERKKQLEDEDKRKAKVITSASRSDYVC